MPSSGKIPDRSSRRRDRAGQDPGAHLFTGTLLLHAFQGFERLLFTGYRKQGETGLRPKHGAVIANIDTKGTRPSVLAARAGITRPAMGELIDELEAAGYVRRVQDPADRRSKLVRPTGKTLARQRLAKRVNAEIEAEYEQHLGSARYRELRRTLAELVTLTASGAEIVQPPVVDDGDHSTTGHRQP